MNWDTFALAAKAAEFNKRIEKFQDLLIRHGLDGCLIVEKGDLYYLSGTVQNAHLFI